MIERCLRRNPAERPNAKEIFETLRPMLPSSAGPRSVIMNTARSGSLAPVVESDERHSSGSIQSGDSSFLEYEAQFRRPERPEDYPAADEGGSAVTHKEGVTQLNSPGEQDKAEA